LEGEKIKLEQDVAKLREKLYALQKQCETDNHATRTHNAALNPFETIDRILEQTSVNVILNYLRSHITTQKPKMSVAEAQKLPMSQHEQENGGAESTNSLGRSTQKSSDSTNEESTCTENLKMTNSASNSKKSIDDGFKTAQIPLNKDVQKQNDVEKNEEYLN
jgi:hypothetical protein